MPSPLIVLCLCMLCLLPWKKRFDHRLFTEVDAYLFIPSGRHQFVCVTMFLVLFTVLVSGLVCIVAVLIHCLEGLLSSGLAERLLACFLHVCFCAGFAITLCTPHKHVHMSYRLVRTYRGMFHHVSGLTLALVSVFRPS